MSKLTITGLTLIAIALGTATTATAGNADDPSYGPFGATTLNNVAGLAFGEPCAQSSGGCGPLPCRSVTGSTYYKQDGTPRCTKAANPRYDCDSPGYDERGRLRCPEGSDTPPPGSPGSNLVPAD